MVENKKVKISQILSFVSLGFSIIAIPFYFVGTLKVRTLAISGYLTLVDLFKDIGEYSGEDEEKIFLLLTIFLIIAIAFTIGSAVLNVFKTKATKIIGFALIVIAIVIDVVEVIYITSSIGDGLIIDATLGYGGIIMLICYAIAFVVATISMILFVSKKNDVDYNTDFGTFQAQSGVIGNNDDTVVIDNQFNNDQVINNNIPSGHIIFLSGCCAGYNIPVSENEKIVVGKDPSQCTVIIDRKYDSVSRKHCEISFSPNSNTYVVIDYSANGTFINNQRLQRGVPTSLNRGTVLTLSKTDNVFKLD